MQERSLLYLKDWFISYVQGFYSTDKQVDFHIKLKENHTLRVMQQAQAIANSLKLPVEKVFLAETIGLLHDIGRFKQYSNYKTFTDAVSVNHAALAVEILQQTELLARAGVAEDEAEIIMKAVLYHNKRDIPPETEEILLFAKLIRDADKLDIFQMIISDDEINKMPPTLEIKADDNIYSTVIVADLLAGKMARHEDIRTSADQMLFRISWLYNIYFKYTYNYIFSRKYLEEMFKQLPDTPEMYKVYTHFSKLLHQKVKNDI